MRTADPSPPRPLLLLVDDDAQIRQLLSEIGSREGFEVLEAADGSSALDALGRRQVDLVLLDLHMPRVNGLDVLRERPAPSMQMADDELYRLIDKYGAKT